MNFSNWYYNYMTSLKRVKVHGNYNCGSFICRYATSCDIILDSYKDEKAIKVPWNSLKKKVM